MNELISRCHPLGSFEQMEAIQIATNLAELYSAVLVDTPLGKKQKLNISN
jgi:V-type H+-transporting ATPase subunit d